MRYTAFSLFGCMTLNHQQFLLACDFTINERLRNNLVFLNRSQRAQLVKGTTQTLPGSEIYSPVKTNLYTFFDKGNLESRTTYCLLAFHSAFNNILWSSFFCETIISKVKNLLLHTADMEKNHFSVWNISLECTLWIKLL